MALADPTLTVSADDGNARVALVVEGSDPSPATPVLRFAVERLEAGTWVPVRGVAALEPDGAWTVTAFDHEAASRGTVTYRAQAFDADDVEAPSAWVTADVVTDVAGWWLQDPAVPTLDVQVNVERTAVSSDRKRDQGRFAPLGWDRDVVVTGDVRGEDITVPLLLVGSALFDAVTEILDGGRTLLLRTADGRRLYVASPAARPTTVQPTTDWAERPVRKMTLAFVEVDRP